MAKWAELTPDVQEHIKRVRAGCLAVCQTYSGKMESEAKANRPWDDKSGNARNRLNAHAELVANTPDYWAAQVVLGHGISYGIYLELGTHFFRNGTASKVTGLNAYPIIGPTIEANTEPFTKACEKLCTGLNGIGKQ